MRDWTPQIKWVPINSVYPYVRNAKQHPKDQIDKIAHQISSVGFTQPIVIDAAEVIIAGHGRYLAAKALNMETIPVITAKHLSEEEVMAYRIADNKVSESTWDMPMLAFDLGTLERSELDLSLTGFSQDDAQSILKDFKGSDLNDTQSAQGASEHSESEYQEFKHKCPKCEFEWN